MNITAIRAVGTMNIRKTSNGDLEWLAIQGCLDGFVPWPEHQGTELSMNNFVPLVFVFGATEAELPELLPD